MSSLREKRLFLLDMDGTIYLDNDLFDGTVEFLNYVKSVGGRYIFLTNNSSESADKYIEKMEGLGIKTTVGDFLTSANATALYLKNKKYKKIYVSGTESLAEQFKSGSLNVITEIEDDIACGVNAGISTIFVLSGEGTMEDVEKSDKKPEYIYENIRALFDDLVK